MTDHAFDMRQSVRLIATKQAAYRDVGAAIGMIERIHFSRRELTVWWSGKGVRINLGFDDVEPVG